jgi:hypothetical protein
MSCRCGYFCTRRHDSAVRLARVWFECVALDHCPAQAVAGVPPEVQHMLAIFRHMPAITVSINGITVSINGTTDLIKLIARVQSSAAIGWHGVWGSGRRGQEVGPGRKP